MCQSIALSQIPSLDQESAYYQRLFPNASQAGKDRAVQLMFLRLGSMQQLLGRIRETGRKPQVCLYALTARNCSPTRSLREARAFAEREGLFVRPGQSFTDLVDLALSDQRPGWATVRQQVEKGYVNGVVALTPSVIAPDINAYERELSWFDTHGGFVGLVHAEVTEPPPQAVQGATT
ncbi:hypothetical protein ACO0M4_05935 [Streptomyces sp. RGM 3693]|uniref:hypothetical protein n=1 Tax=Streptomyces sp. RGM 3693 TaxID=3413284 RepID=UPI003D2994D2